MANTAPNTNNPLAHVDIDTVLLFARGIETGKITPLPLQKGVVVYIAWPPHSIIQLSVEIAANRLEIPSMWKYFLTRRQQLCELGNAVTYAKKLYRTRAVVIDCDFSTDSFVDLAGHIPVLNAVAVENTLTTPYTTRWQLERAKASAHVWTALLATLCRKHPCPAP